MAPFRTSEDTTHAKKGQNTHRRGDEEPHRSEKGREEDEGVEGGYHRLGATLARVGQQPLQRRRGEEQESQP